MPTISTYTHTCVIQDGETHLQTVDAWEYETGRTCDYCGERLVTTEQLLAHIYRELTE